MAKPFTEEVVPVIQPNANTYYCKSNNILFRRDKKQEMTADQATSQTSPVTQITTNRPCNTQGIEEKRGKLFHCIRKG
jgi:hypothetical protein